MFSIVTDFCCFDVVSSDSLSLSLPLLPSCRCSSAARLALLVVSSPQVRGGDGTVPPFLAWFGGVVVAAFVSCLLLCRAVLAIAVSVRLSIHLSFGQSIRLPAVHVCHLVLICVRFAVFFFVLHVSLAVFSSLTVRLHVCVC